VVKLNLDQVKPSRKVSKRYVMLIAFTAFICSIIYLMSFYFNNLVVEVTTVKLVKTEINSTVSCNGELESTNTNNVYYSIPLKAKNIKVKIGDYVSAGQTLIDVDTTETVQAFNNLNKKTNSTSSQQTDLTSISGLINQNQSSINANDYTSLIQSYQNNTSNSSNNNTNQSNGSNDTDYPEIPSFVKSPIAGVVTSLNVSTGEFSDTSQPIVSVSDVKNMQVKAQVDEFLIEKVKVGQNVTIKGNGFNSVYNGVITQIYPTARQILNSSGSRTVVDIIVSVSAPSSELKPGLSADVSIITAVNKQACTVPYEAINEDDKNNEYVYVCKNDKVTKTYIKTGMEYDNCVEIISGIKIGESIVMSPPLQLKNGKKVIQIKTSNNSAPAS
jgi:HlyD family secretion protein